MSPIWNSHIMTCERTIENVLAHAFKLAEAFSLWTMALSSSLRSHLLRRLICGRPGEVTIWTNPLRSFKVLINWERICPFVYTVLTRPKITVTYRVTVRPAQRTKKTFYIRLVRTNWPRMVFRNPQRVERLLQNMDLQCCINPITISPAARSPSPICQSPTIARNCPHLRSNCQMTPSQ